MEMLWMIFGLVWFLFWMQKAWQRAYKEFSGWALCKEVLLDAYAVISVGNPDEVITWGSSSANMGRSAYECSKSPAS